MGNKLYVFTISWGESPDGSYTEEMGDTNVIAEDIHDAIAKFIKFFPERKNVITAINKALESEVFLGFGA